MIGNQHMAPSGTAFLSQTASVLRDDTFAFNLRGVAQQLANGDNASATHASDHYAIGFRSGWQCGYG